MKTLSVVAFLTLAAVQFVPPPQVAPQGPPQGGNNPAAAPTQPTLLNAAECKCSIEVTVKHAVTGEPIGDVEITLNSQNTNADLLAQALQSSALSADALQALQSALAAGRGNRTGTQAALTATTDSAGRAMFPNLAEGSYSVIARLDGYFSLVNDNYVNQATAFVPLGPPNGRGGTVPGVVTITKQPTQQITLSMIHGSTVAGRIQDANRRPATGAQVGAFRVAYQYGHRILNQAGTPVMTDDRGEYRLFWLPPGEYYIRTGGSRTPILAAGGTNYSAPIYYPGTMDAKTATLLVVREGNNMSGIDIGLPATTGVTVSGTIINTIQGGRAGPNGQINRAVSSVFLVPRNADIFDNPPLLPNIGGAARAARGGTAIDSESSFEIRGVPPGSYDFYPVYNDGSSNILNSYFTARTPIEVGSENVTGIQSVIKPGSELKGKVTISGTPPTPARGQSVQAITLTNMRVQIQPRENIPSLARGGLSQSPALDADGNFTLTNLVDAKVFISGVAPLPTDAYVAEIRQDSRSVFDDNVITIGKDSQTTLEIIVSRGGGTIQGTVRDAKNNPVPVQRIMLVPDPPRRQNPMLYKTGISNPMGNFTISGVAPGSYKLYAWDQITAGAEQDPEFMNAYDALGTHVNVTAGLSLTDLQVTPISVRH